MEVAKAAPALVRPAVVKKPTLNWDKIDRWGQLSVGAAVPWGWALLADRPVRPTAPSCSQRLCHLWGKGRRTPPSAWAYGKPSAPTCC